MSYDKYDFLLLKNNQGYDVLVNVPRIQFIVETGKGEYNIFFGPGEDDYIAITGTVDDFQELL
jgi:hypothetical protein